MSITIEPAAICQIFTCGFVIFPGSLGNVAGGAPGAVDASRSMTVLTCDITKTHSTPKSANDHFLKEWSPNGRRV
jgi:hypothetical protein